ncbi:hypothetical protein Rt10032_c12g4919 [Rhodotorula toruloides]|uniref:Uncharacterized protein n=1 Tax=Rhodotorula toruloides TaxID=5286 RepID=A0A511KKJ7_RHOTO|nr:hypothetical protein Rt10032_c12g4919 [Rhodotorula toruloides]
MYFNVVVVEREMIACPLLDEVEEALSREADGLRLKDGDVQGMLFDEPFVLLDFLLPLISASASARPTSDRAKACLSLVATLSSPKEVVVGVGQKLSELITVEVSAFGDDNSSEDEREAGDVYDSAVQLACLIGLYARALPRIATKRFRQFTEPACEATLSALSYLAAEGAFHHSGTLDAESPATDYLASLVFRQVSSLVSAMERPIGLGEMEPLATEPLRTLFYETAGRLHSFFSLHLAADVAVEMYPHARERFTRAEEPEMRETWLHATVAAASLRDNAPMLLVEATADSEAPLALRLGKFVTALHLIAIFKPRSITDDHMPWPFGSPYEKSLPFLREAIQHSELRLGEDELLFWLWWVVVSRPRRYPWDIMPLEMAFSILEILTPLAAQSPSPVTRFLAYTLLDHLVTSFDDLGPSSSGHLVEGEAAQMALLRVVVVECPFVNMRDAAVGLVKKVVLSKLDSDSESLFLSDALFSSPLGHSILTAFPPSPTSASSPSTIPSMTAGDFVEHHHRGVMERLSLVYVLLKRDTANRVRLLSFPSLLLYPARARG